MSDGVNEWTAYTDRASRLFTLPETIDMTDVSNMTASFDRMCHKLREVLTTSDRDAAKEILARFGYAKARDVPEHRFAAVIAACEERLRASSAVGVTDETAAEAARVLDAINAAATTRTVLDEASSIIRGARQSSHGAPERSFSTIADFWNAYLAAVSERAGIAFIPLAPYQVADLMELLKIARAVTGDPTHRDHYVDRIGYAALAHELVTSGHE